MAPIQGNPLAWPVVALGVGIGLTVFGPNLRIAAPTAAPEPVIAVLLPAPAPAGLDLLELLEPLRRPHVPGMPWLGGDLIEVPGASDYRLWQRTVSGRIDPESDAINLFDTAGIPVYGDWRDLPDAAHDRELLRSARAQIDATAGAVPSAVVLLSCSKTITELTGGPCREVFLEAVTLLEDAARAGGTGLLLAVPVRGFPQIGTVWAIGPNIQERVDFRFRMIDLAPTMLRLLDLPVPPVLDGAPGYDLTRFEHLFHRPLRWIGGGT